jgi:hypothetical protein
MRPTTHIKVKTMVNRTILSILPHATSPRRECDAAAAEPFEAMAMKFGRPIRNKMYDSMRSEIRPPRRSAARCRRREELETEEANLQFYTHRIRIESDLQHHGAAAAKVVAAATDHAKSAADRIGRRRWPAAAAATPLCATRLSDAVSAGRAVRARTP